MPLMPPAALISAIAIVNPPMSGSSKDFMKPVRATAAPMTMGLWSSEPDTVGFEEFAELAQADRAMAPTAPTASR